MNVKLNYKNIRFTKNSVNHVLFTDENYNINNLKKYLLSKEFSIISDLLKSKDLKKNIISIDINSNKTIFLISFKKEIQSSDIESLGAKFFSILKDLKANDCIINSDTAPTKLNNAVGYFLHGFKLKSYIFEKYKTKKNKKIINIHVVGKKIPSSKDQLRFRSIEEGTFLTRDLVSEPGNVLHPDEYAKRLKSLKKDGLKVTI